VRFHHRSLIFSATDLVNFLGCRHAAFLDRRALDEPVAPEAADPLLRLLREKGLAHERRFLDGLTDQGRTVVEIPGRPASPAERHTATVEAMRRGADVIYQAALPAGQWHGYADFLLKVPGPSAFGDYRYEPLDTKLAGSPKPTHALQLSTYSMLLASAQGTPPAHMHVVLGDERMVSLRVADLHYYFESVRQRFEDFFEPLPAMSAGEPCGHCGVCRWSEHCAAEWERADHLSLVANISRAQRTKLEAAGISTMAALGSLKSGARIPGLQPAIFSRLRTQARLQTDKRRDGESRHELLPAVEGKGFARLPRPDPGDVFFDMEGDPLFAGGLEYLFGFVHVAGGEPVFVPFWGHTREEEKRAFERAIDFIIGRLETFPDAHVYHYASYEETALKRLAMLHGTREEAVDQLLRSHKLVDLYRVVREGIQVSEPGYSIKNLETFYMEARTGEVTSAGASMVVYEHWRQLRDPRLLQEISDYNEADCRSTRLLRDWLLSLRPEGAPWYTGDAQKDDDPARSARRRDAEQRAAGMITSLARAPSDELPFRELVGQLLEFHRREDKPSYWAMFNRQEMSEEELIEDAECIGGLRRDPQAAPYALDRSMVHTFRFPIQDFKMRVGDCPKRAATLEPAGEVVFIDEDARLIGLKVGKKAAPHEEAFSLIPPGPLKAGVLKEAVYRYADEVVAGGAEYAAITSILKRERPRVQGLRAGADIIPAGTDIVPGAVSAITRLDRSHMLVQGPPGTGKTFLSASAVVELLSQGRRVGVASNSHKAINNLLAEIERQAAARGVRFRGAKKCSAEEHRLGGTLIADLFENDEVSAGIYDLIAGTAWMFARPEFDQSVDTLFIDEAGQVSLANVVAMGTSARNIVLVGDQMQLGQPIQGAHPGESGRSALEFVLGEMATVPTDRGIFLPVTRRMNPRVCRFISEAVYEGRLQPEAKNAAQRLVLSGRADPALRASGICWVPVAHDGCRQKSNEEAARIAELYRSLLRQRWTNRDGITAPLGASEVLVVAPYNMQVNLIKSVLPDGARVGTVDKFQGQEAAVVLVSMTTSTAEDVSRGLEFLYSRNRLNVAISRARCLAVVVASPRLLEAPCNTIEQMKLVNTLCFVKAYADEAIRTDPGLLLRASKKVATR
jgi:predicted RecB family nuclease